MPKRSDHEDVLDNPVWHSLKGRLSHFASVDSTADLVHFDPEVNLFSGVDQNDQDMWTRIAEHIDLEDHCALFRDSIAPPPGGWEEHFRGPCYQMVAGDLDPSSDATVDLLAAEDASEMLELAELTEPGPFFARTFELGRYVGIRREGRLVAMAGERFRVPGFVEVSAVCTHPDARGEGLAGELTLNVAHSIRAGGDQAFLHVLETNETAIRLYEKIGFVIRRKIDVSFAQWHGADWRPGEPD